MLNSIDDMTNMQNWKPPIKTSINILEIIVLSPKEVIVDGINVGSLVDAIANMPQFAAKFQAALEAAWDEKFSDTSATPTAEKVSSSGDS